MNLFRSYFFLNILENIKGAESIKLPYTESSLDIIDNSNIGHSFLGMHGLHLIEHGVGQLALNFVNKITLCNGFH